MAWPLRTIPWFHGKISRHIAETLLMANGEEGSYLLREREPDPSSTEKMPPLVLSVRSNSVSHNLIEPKGTTYSFGLKVFANINAFLEYFANRPSICGQSGVYCKLRYPYPCDVSEHNAFEEVREVHESDRASPVKEDVQPVFAVATSEGHLYKKGAIHKNWKKRWFVVEKRILCYFENKGDTKPIREIDINQATEIAEDPGEEDGHGYLFHITLPGRRFLLSAASEEEREQWLWLLNWKPKTLD